MKKKNNSFQHATIGERKDISNHIVFYSRKKIKNSEKEESLHR